MHTNLDEELLLDDEDISIGDAKGDDFYAFMKKKKLLSKYRPSSAKYARSIGEKL